MGSTSRLEGVEEWLKVLEVRDDEDKICGEEASYERIQPEAKCVLVVNCGRSCVRACVRSCLLFFVQIDGSYAPIARGRFVLNGE